jgi:hypothetical protein
MVEIPNPQLNNRTAGSWVMKGKWFKLSKRNFIFVSGRLWILKKFSK